MKLLTFKKQTQAGFRLNISDVIFISLLSALSYLLYVILPELSLYLIPIYLGASFFCFCNIFRIGNKLEPFWYIPFVIVSLYCLNTFDFPLFWALVLYILEPLKWALIIYSMTQNSYHGLGYKWINRLKS